MKLAHLSKPDLPREKLIRYGPGKLRDFELLAIILGSGTKGKNVLELSREILKRWREPGLGSATLDELTQIRGLGRVKAGEIVACLELGRRVLKDKQAVLLLTPKDVWERMVDVRESKKEHLVVFYLDSHSQETRRDIVSVGTIDATMAHPREVFEEAIKHNAGSILLAHNHPSGDTTPSQADLEITKKIASAGKLLDIELVDHVIVTKSSWKSILSGIYG